MRLDKGTLSEIAHRLRESKKVLERTHYRISQTLEGFESLHETVEKASYLIGHSSVRSNDVQVIQK
jgi:hypothetical protein